MSLTEEDVIPVAIIGAGPVGMTLALLLAEQGISSTVFESRTSIPDGSMAIGITPPSLALFDRLGLLHKMTSRGVQVRKVHVFENNHLCGTLSFDSIPSPTPYVLSLPQSRTLHILRDAVDKEALIHLKSGYSFKRFEESGGYVEITLNHPEGGEDNHRCSWLVGADGAHSRVRDQLKSRQVQKSFPYDFFMADIKDERVGSSDARLYFDSSMSLESFPLPNEARRWVIGRGKQTPEDLKALLLGEVSRITGQPVSESQIQWSSQFRPEFSLVESYGNGRTFLVGDAAHVTTPIGGQGMNIGLADAYDLSKRLRRLLQQGSDLLMEHTQYTAIRRSAFLQASKTGIWGMWVGTRTGKGYSYIRRMLLKGLLSRPLHNLVARRFSMTHQSRVIMPSSFQVRAELNEKMDDLESDFEQLHNTLSQFAWINVLFTRTHSLLKRELFSCLDDNTSSIHVVDFGAGGGDVALWILKEARKRGLDLTVTAIDQDVRCIDYMNHQHAGVEGLRVVHGGVEELSALPAIDYLIGNHVLHHINAYEMKSLLDQLAQHVGRKMIFSDLKRSYVAYGLFSMAAGVMFHKSFIVEDGLISIRRGFRKGELSGAAGALNENWSVKESACFPFRIHLIMDKK